MGERVAFLCLGTMGAPMAAHLCRAGHAVTAYNRTVGRAELLATEHGARVAATPAEAVGDAQVVFACTGADADLRAITLGEGGAFAAMAPGSVFVDHTTASAGIARELAAAAEARGFAFLDAPVSGGEDGAKRGALTVMVGGDESAFARVEPLVRCFAQEVRRMGPAGSGQLTKMVNQVCIAGIVQGLSEGLALAERTGLDPDAVVEVIAKGAAQSWQMDHRAATMNRGEFDFGFAVDWMRKDLGMALEEARRVGARLPVAALVDQFYAAVQARGGGRHDTSSLIALLRDA